MEKNMKHIENKNEPTPPWENENIPIGEEIDDNQKDKIVLKNKLKTLESEIETLRDGGRSSAQDLIQRYKRKIRKIKRLLEKIDPDQTELDL